MVVLEWLAADGLQHNAYTVQHSGKEQLRSAQGAATSVTSCRPSGGMPTEKMIGCLAR